MSIFSKLFNSGASEGDNRLSSAEGFMNENTCLFRHYNLQGTQDSVAQWTGVQLSEQEAADLVQKLRTQNGLGANRPHQMPGYREED